MLPAARGIVAKARKPSPKIHVYHATAPTCWWSWGYEAVMNRIPLVYGDQVDIHILYGVVYEDLDEYLKHYELTFDSLNAWAREATETMGVPIRSNYGPKEPRNLLPATHAVFAALKQGRAKGERFNRSILRRFDVEGEDVTHEGTLVEAANEAGLDVPRFREDFGDTEARQGDMQQQGHAFGHLPIGFYNLAVTDGADRTVILDYAFDPPVVEEAIDYLSRDALAKRTPTDIAGYLRHHGPAPLRELARVFGIPEPSASAKLRRLEKEKKVAAVEHAAAPHWRVVR